MISRISGSSLSRTMRPDSGKWRSRSTAEKILAIVRSAYPQNLCRCSRGWHGGRAAIVATRQFPSQPKAASGLIVRKPFGPVQFGQPTLDFRQEDVPLYRVIDCGICRHGLQHFDDPISSEWLLHDRIVIQTFVPSLGGSKPSGRPAVRKFENRPLGPTNSSKTAATHSAADSMLRAIPWRDKLARYVERSAPHVESPGLWAWNGNREYAF